MIERIELNPYMTLHCIQDRRFKQGCLSVQLLSPMQSCSVAQHALLPSILLRGTRSCPDLRSITQRLDTLYGAAVSPLVRRVGDYQTTGLYCGFMDDRFALPGDKVLAPMVDFLGELLLDSPTQNSGYLPAFVESEKKNLISAIESERNDKRLYAMNRLLEQMCGDDSYGLPRLGRAEDVKAITPVSAYEGFQATLRTAPIEIFYVGSASAGQVAQLVQPVFAGVERTPAALPAQSPLRPGTPGEVVEEMDVSQGKLCMGFVTPITKQSPLFPAMQVLNVIFGGGMTSKLFQTVRETLSLCYYVSSTYYSTKGIVTVSAGIDFAQKERTCAEILRQLEACCRGEISEVELRAGKEALFSGLRGVHDSPSAIESYYSTGILSGRMFTPAEHMAAVEAVTIEQLVEAARSITLHTTYFLKGGNP